MAKVIDNCFSCSTIVFPFIYLCKVQELYALPTHMLIEYKIKCHSMKIMKRNVILKCYILRIYCQMYLMIILTQIYTMGDGSYNTGIDSIVLLTSSTLVQSLERVLVSYFHSS
jgi:hypothetical protein